MRLPVEDAQPQPSDVNNHLGSNVARRNGIVGGLHFDMPIFTF